MPNHDSRDLPRSTNNLRIAHTERLCHAASSAAEGEPLLCPYHSTSEKRRQEGREERKWRVRRWVRFT
ncbi:hypothetical protein GUJ93_ZPchr0012g19739 [Zizania palustris]|uniref:Uncharacterized protein n=1 Tax=Zizania palustris TaxID=103762 RepID=A0A8J6BR76_ZIZPA|nr:hypothetical protein GUJ93_ZPchr0006g42968 [Zizania palustris]KAG8092864.1 hypothetical protein GUJ93_ZPchr0012g19739 [Zizania palustris]